jgi:hypothetical protein
MLTDAEDEGVVQGYVRALRLCDVQIVPLSVWCWVQGEERVRRVAAGMRHGKAKGQSVRILLVRMLQLSETVLR